MAEPLGLRPEDEEQLKDAFRAELMRGGLSPIEARSYDEVFRDDFRALTEDLKEVPHGRAKELARSHLAGSVRALLEARAKAKPPVPVAPPEVPRMEALPEPRAVRKICPLCGKSFVSADAETLWWVRSILPIVREYFELCPYHQKERMGYPPPEDLIQEAVEAGLYPPVTTRFLSRVAEVLKAAKRPTFR